MPASLAKPRALAALDPGQRAIVNAARQVSRSRGEPLYLVGGAVRDILLRRPVGDVDFTVEGDAASFARSLARPLRAEVLRHDRFRTATLALPGGGRVDVATARAESYGRPGALPTVRPAGILEDLARRDFTINSLALRLAPEFQPALIDPAGGRRDLSHGKIRFLHDRSPIDDPTRAFRAVRYANRFRFSIPAETRRSIRIALEKGAFLAVSGDRLRREVEKIFGEPDRARAVSLLALLGLQRVLHPDLDASPEVLRRLRRAEKSVAGEGGWLLYLLVWSADLDAPQASELARRLNLPRRDAERLTLWPGTLAALRGMPARDGRGPALRRRLSPEETIAALACLTPRERHALSRTSARPAALSIGGRDLLRAGATPGPSIGEALARTLSARQDGRISVEEELAFALAAWREKA